MQPRPYQIEAMQSVARSFERGYKNPLAICATGLGKAQPVDAKILTPTGWKQMGDIHIGEEVINPAGGVARIIGIFPQGEVDIYKVTFSDGSSTECCADHLWEWTTRSRKSRKLPSCLMPLKCIQAWMGEGKGHDNLYIPIAERIDFVETTPFLDPYLLGLLLGDGSLSRTDRVGFTTVDVELAESFSSLLPVGHTVRAWAGKESEKAPTYNVRGQKQNNQVVQALRKLGLSGTTSYTKFIPKNYLITSRSNRIALLQGLMDTDGTVSGARQKAKQTRSLSYSTSSATLRDDVCFLVRSLGGITRASVKKPFFTYKGERKQGADNYVIQVNLPPDIQPFRLKRKQDLRQERIQENTPTRYFETIEPVGKKQAQCIKLDSENELYITDDFIITHNTVISHEVIKNQFPISEHRTMFLVGMADLVRQTKRAFGSYSPEWNERKWTKDGRPGLGIVMGDVDQPDARVVIGTPQTLSGAEKKADFDRLERVLKYGKIDTLVIDEAHLSIADSYMRLVKAIKDDNPDLNVVGFTATAWRTDGRGLNNMFDVRSCNYNLRWGILNNYLCPILDPLQVETNIMFEGRTADDDELARAIDVKNWAELVLEGYLKNGEHRLAAGFFPSVEHSREFCRYAQSKGVPCAHVDSEMCIMPDGQEMGSKQRYAIYEWFGSDKAENEDRILANYNILITGWDCPAVACILWARPTTNELIMTQGIGRGTRIHPSKKDLLILDYALKGLKLISVNSIVGLSYDANGETAEKEVEQLDEGMDIRDVQMTKEPSVVDGKGIVIKVGKLLSHSKNSWYSYDGDNTMSLACGDNHILFVVPPFYTLAKRIEEGLQAGEIALEKDPTNIKKQDFYKTLLRASNIFSNYTLWKLSKDGNRWRLADEPLLVDDNPMSLFDRSVMIEDQLIGDDAALTKKGRAWRRKPASEKQLELLHRLGAPDDPSDMGDAAKMITHWMAAPRIATAIIDPLRKDCKIFGILPSQLKLLEPQKIDRTPSKSMTDTEFMVSIVKDIQEMEREEKEMSA